ncbi:MAG: hypothetical protein LQ341_001560 [Variospora aurantia]|nr:MAG: hypothetical protein LQ341_001560 [Variospora aurantia]
MRFGCTFHEHQLPGWTSQYLDYAALKKLAKQRSEQHACIAYFRDEIRKVEEFYLTQYEHAQVRAAYFSQDGTRHALDSVRLLDANLENESHFEGHYGGLLELLDILQKVRWFGYVNQVASQRILKKFGRFFAVPHLITELDSLLNGQTFVQQEQCQRDFRDAETAIDSLTDLHVDVWTETLCNSESVLLRNLSLRSKEPLNALGSILARRERARKALYKGFRRRASNAYPRLDDSLIDNLKTADGLGRLATHYAAEAGLLDLCRFFLQAEEGHLYEHAADVLLTPDVEGNTPLHLSVIGSHAEVTEYLVKAVRDGAEPNHPGLRKWPETLASMLHTAARANSTRIFQVLCRNGAGFDHVGSHGETVLHVAARNGNLGMIACIPDPAALRGLSDTQESTYGRTALMHACAGGFESIVKILILAGADPNIFDAHGWTAKEHAAFRGHLGLLKYLEPALPPEETAIRVAPEPNEIEQEKHIELPRPGDTGERLDPTQAQIQISLGASNTRSKTKMLELQLPRWSEDDALRDQVGFALEVSMSGASNLKRTIQLPVLEDLTDFPICFAVSDPQEAYITFRLVRLQIYSGGDAELIGSGVAIMKTLRERLASKHESLVRDHTIPILGKDMLDVVGRLTFSFLIISPFNHLSAPSGATRGFWKEHGRTEVVGHRGSGANTTSKSNLQIGENTIQSFVSAVAAGASCVEFDVQLTKDLVPVIFHDFLVMETGGDVPLHTLTRDQFMHLSELQSSKVSHLKEFNEKGRNIFEAKGPRPRSMSENGHHDGHDERIRQRMRYTEEGIRNELKGNLRGISIQEPSTTLAELFTQLSESIAFNLEMKDRSMEFFAVEINLFVDTILDMVDRLGGKRSITFSSFSPEICILLSIKQPKYPVLFISKAGSVPTGDIRAGSLQQAMHFVKRWRLAGIVMLSDVFVPCPRLLRYAKREGLVCGSYGNLNDDPACAKIQAEAGLDAIMVNKVRLITQELTKSSD